MSNTKPGLLKAIQLIKNKIANIIKHDLIIVQNILKGSLATNHPVIKITNKTTCPKKPKGKKIITIKKTNTINFNEGLKL
jgi:hypothetical protein